MNKGRIKGKEERQKEGDYAREKKTALNMLKRKDLLESYKKNTGVTRV